MRTNRSIQLQNCQMSLSAQHDQRSSIRHSAIQYGHNGWKVLPCIPTGNKNKAPLLTHGFKDASSNPAVITSWWGSFPDALIGLAVPVGLVVLDIDPRDGGSLEQLEALAGGPLPETLTAESGRGDGGRHYWVSTAARDLKHSGLPKGVDLREGGKSYVIAPPSLHPTTGKPYRWVNNAPIAPLPPSLLSVLKPQKKLGVRPFSGDSADHSSLTRYMSRAVTGERNDSLFWCACRMAETEMSGKPVSWDGLFDAAIGTGMSMSEAHSTIQSAYRTVHEGRSQK